MTGLSIARLFGHLGDSGGQRPRPSMPAALALLDCFTVERAAWFLTAFSLLTFPMSGAEEWGRPWATVGVLMVFAFFYAAMWVGLALVLAAYELLRVGWWAVGRLWRRKQGGLR